VSGDESYSYGYDGANNRIDAMRNGTITKYIYDASGNLLAEADAGNTITRYYIYGQGLLAMVTPADELYCYHFDAIGSTIAITDSSQQVVNAYAYTPFGVITNKQETISQPFTFVGQHGVMTEPNGVYYMRARYYDPQVGRFISQDPLGFDGGDVNLYIYAANNPIVFLDPFGLWTLGIDLSGTIGGIFGFTGGVTFAIDDDFNIAAIPHGGGGYLVGAGVSGNAQLQWTNADTVYNLGGVSTSTGGSVGDLVGITGEYIQGDGYSGFNIGGFIGKGLLPASMHHMAEVSKVYATNLIGGSSPIKNGKP
jgi:RHS repeat-associated protein